MRTIMWMMAFVLLLSASAASTHGGERRMEEPAAQGVELPDCSFTIKSKENGIVTSLVITVSDVSFSDCLLLKAGVLASQIKK